MPSAETGDAASVSSLLLRSMDDVWTRQRGRLDGLSQDEYLWEPVADCWTVRREDDGVWRVDARRLPEPDPAPVTTIAWRLCHIATDCLASYTSRGLGPWPLEVHGTEWYGDVDDALAALDRSWDAFRSGVAGLGESGMWRLLGDEWGPYASESWAALVVHAIDELAHHGAEVGLLRDLYLHQNQ